VKELVIFTLQLIVTNKKIKVMTAFKDLKFKKKWNGVGSNYTFDNGITLSVQAGSGIYSTPREDHSSADDYSSFEIAIWNEKGEWITQDIIPTQDGEVKGWVSRDEIDEIISIIKSK
jgi:hypothetical protein